MQLPYGKCFALVMQKFYSGLILRMPPLVTSSLKEWPAGCKIVYTATTRACMLIEKQA